MDGLPIVKVSSAHLVKMDADGILFVCLLRPVPGETALYPPATGRDLP